MSMVEQFFSLDYAGRGDLFKGLSIWEDEEYRELQGTYPVISLSFARVKEINYSDTRTKICEIIRNLFIKYSYLKDSAALIDADRDFFDRILAAEINNSDAISALYQLSNYLYRYYGKKVIILLDEYDTPMQEAYVNGYWAELAGFTRSLFNSAFKTNPWLERAILNFLDTGKYDTYWANTSSNSLVGKLLQEGNRRIKEQFECLLQGKTIRTPIDEQIVYDQLDNNEAAIWSLLLASGYLKVLNYEREELLKNGAEPEYELTITNYETERMFRGMVRGWFSSIKSDIMILSRLC